MVELNKLTISEVLKRSVDLYSDNVALSGIEDNSINYSQFNDQIKKISDFLKEKGIVSGDRVAILSENSPNWGIAYFAITTMGSVAVPIMTEFQSADVHHILNHSGAKALFISARLFEKIEEFKSETLNTFNSTFSACLNTFRASFCVFGLSFRTDENLDM